MELCRFQWPRDLRRGFAAAHLLRLRVRIPPVKRMPVSCECCVLSGCGLCVGLITPTECGVSECDREASIMGRTWPTRGYHAMGKRIRNYSIITDYRKPFTTPCSFLLCKVYFICIGILH
jgi:hypothetical protein